MENRHVVVQSGIGAGSVMAMIISWSLHGSIFWAIVHGSFSWFYVIYFYTTK